jgi:Subtilase family
VTFGLVASAYAAFPYPAPPAGTAPQDYAAYMFLSAGSPLPNELTNPGILWKFTSQPSGNSAVDNNPNELGGVEGMSVDLAWQVTTGRPDVVIAVLDSGIEWNNLGAMNDLARKVHLNRGELPLPENADGLTKPDLIAQGQQFLNPDPYDLNDDGVFNVEDYANDPRVHDANGNGILDPEDLILIFSDGVDNDHNGYVDDIAGWNFLDDDNDPFDEVQYGHGTGEAEDSNAEANNGGDVGTCPDCMVLPVRVGDSFIADSNKFAKGVVFAVDSGAYVIQEALGTLNNTSFARAAIDYAYANDVPVIASAADEESFHHNVPSGNRHTITVNSVTKFATGMSPQSYLYLNGCTNFGGNIAVAISSSSCSSEATGKASGIAGLIISAALNQVDSGNLAPRFVDHTGAVHPLSANEVAQLMTMNADDINFSGDRSVTYPLAPTIRFASTAGWDQYFGYGRENANRAVRAVQALRIPPEADILTPDWWSILDPVRTPTVAVTGSVGAVRAASYGYELAFGCGVQPADSSFTVISQQQSLSAPINGAVLGQWSIGSAASTCGINPSATPTTAASGTPSPSNTPDQFTVTLRLRVTDNHGVIGESRRTVFLHHDPDLLAGFPLSIGGSGEAPAVFANFAAGAEGKGASANSVPVLIVPNSDGTVLAIDPAGKTLPGWPVHTDPIGLHTGSWAFQSGALKTTWYEPIEFGAAVGDLDGNGHVEIVADTLDGKLYVWRQHGQLANGFPVSTNPVFSERSIRDRYNRLQRGFFAPPVLADLDGDGKLEIVASAMDRHVYAWKSDGTPVPGWPVLVVDRTQMASVDPVTGHVVPRMVTGVSVALQGSKIISMPAVGDLNGDGKPVVVVGTNEEYREAPNFSPLGNFALTFAVEEGLLSAGNGRVYAIPADGNLDPVASSNPAGPFLAGWPVHIAILDTELLPWIEGVIASPALADVAGDGKLEVGINSVVGPAYVLRADGSSFYGNDPYGLPIVLPTDGAEFGAQSNSLDSPSLPMLGSGTFAKLDSSGAFVFATPGAGLGKLFDGALPAEQLPHDAHIDAWNVATGAFVTGFPHLSDDFEFFVRPTVGNLTADGLAEIVAGSGGYLLHAPNELGVEPTGWPKFTGGWMTAAAVSRHFGNGQAVAITTREGNLFVWRFPVK